MIVNSFRDLIVWQKAFALSIVIYKITETFPKEDLYGLTSQVRRSAISIPSNIAEGRHRGTRKDFTQFLRIAYGSGAELETQIEIAKALEKVSQGDYLKIIEALTEVMKILNVMIKKLSNGQAKS